MTARMTRTRGLPMTQGGRLTAMMALVIAICWIIALVAYLS